ncbi:MAG: HAD family hydrolase [Lachnospiraceae bacterium]|nr:HAD family hydrolase [Lachnospiraceae bacterium]
MKYRNFVFDFYGTLVDVFTDEDSGEADQAIAAFFTEHGAAYSPEEFGESFSRRRKEQLKNRQGSIYAPTGEKIRFPEMDVQKIYVELFKAKGVPNAADYALQAARYYRKVSTVRLKRYPGVKELFERLREAGRGIYLLSNAQREYTRYDLEVVGLDTMFDGILLSSDYGCRKPDPIFFGELTRQFGVKPGEALMIGNDRSSDIYGAGLFGMDSVLFVSDKGLAAPMDGVESTYTVEGGTYQEFMGILPGLLAL